MKYRIEAFRSAELDGVGLVAGAELAEVESQVPFPSLLKALAAGIAEPVRVEDAPVNPVIDPQ